MAFWIVPHAVVLSISCSWFGVAVNVSGVIRWTIWNTVSRSHHRNVLATKYQDISEEKCLRPWPAHVMCLSPAYSCCICKVMCILVGFQKLGWAHSHVVMLSCRFFLPTLCLHTIRCHGLRRAGLTPAGQTRLFWTLLCGITGRSCLSGCPSKPLSSSCCLPGATVSFHTYTRPMLVLFLDSQL